MAGRAEPAVDVEDLFRAHYARVARVIARLVRDHARAEELAVEVFVTLWRKPLPPGADAGAWLYRVAVRKGLDDLRRHARRTRYERLFGWLTGSSPPTPEQTRAAQEEAARVRTVLAALPRRQAELLVLRADGLSYKELGAALALKETSVGASLTRAQESFRKEYGRRYDES